VSKNKNTLQYIIDFQAEHACDDHSGEYYVIHTNGSHHQLMKKDISLWSLLLVCSHHSIEKSDAKIIIAYRLKVHTKASRTLQVN
jgi:hypothetical protein